MQLDRDSIGLSLQIAGFLLTVCGIVYTWVATRDKDNSQHIKAVEEALGKQIADHALRIERLETSMRHGPTAQQVTDLQVAVAKLDSNQDAFLRESNALRLAVSQLNEAIQGLRK